MIKDEKKEQRAENRRLGCKSTENEFGKGNTFNIFSKFHNLVKYVNMLSTHQIHVVLTDKYTSS